MTLPRYLVICEHWRHTPPVSQTAAVLARYYGALKPAKAKPTADSKDTDRAALADLLGNAAGFKTKRPEWLKKT